jgi:uncharacterized protein
MEQIMKAILLKILAVLALLSINPLASAASFDCSKASNTIERAICNNRRISLLDDELASVYKELMQKHPLPDYVKARQRDWNKVKAFCEGPTLLECLEQTYRVRISQLTLLPNSMVFSSNPNNGYVIGDVVFEIHPSDKRVSLWSAMPVTGANGKKTYVVCEYEGLLQGSGQNQAVDASGVTINFEVKAQQVVLEPSLGGKISKGLGDLPRGLGRVKG